MNDKRIMLQPFLAVLVYRTQKALRSAPDKVWPEAPEER